MEKFRINTNMASEFWFYAQLHRLGYESYITLGNTKAIDIIVRLNNSKQLTFDVKGKETFNSGTYQYLPENKLGRNHYFAFIGLQARKHNNNFVKIEEEPQCFIIHSKNLKHFAHKWESSTKTSQGYGMNGRFLGILKKYSSEKSISNKSDLQVYLKAKTANKFNGNDFRKLKKMVLTLEDFESKFYKFKQ